MMAVVGIAVEAIRKEAKMLVAVVRRITMTMDSIMIAGIMTIMGLMKTVQSTRDNQSTNPSIKTPP